MRRVIVIGCPGGGKSTFSRHLSCITGIALYHLDLLYWNKDKTTVDKEVFCERLKAVLEEESWIIDGNYGGTMEMRIAECDTVFLFDIPTEICLSGVRERQGKPRPDMPWIENEDDEVFIEFIRQFNNDSRPKISDLLNKYCDKNIIVFTSRAEADGFLEKLKTEYTEKNNE